MLNLDHVLYQTINVYTFSYCHCVFYQIKYESLLVYMYHCLTYVGADRRDVLPVSPIDYCYNDPCMGHGICISTKDR